MSRENMSRENMPSEVRPKKLIKKLNIWGQRGQKVSP